MKVVFDIDGTLTNFNKFIWENAVAYFKKKYCFEVINPEELEIEDIFDICNVLVQSGSLYCEAVQEKERMLNRFWISHRFIKFLLSRFRSGAGKYINYLKRQGVSVEIHSSRLKTCENNLLGIITRILTVWQFWLNGVFLCRRQFFFYPNDKEKVAGILKANPTIVFEDKQRVVMDLAESDKKVLCVLGLHNKLVSSSRNIEVINGFEKNDIEEKMEKLLGKTNYSCHRKEAKSAYYFGVVGKVFPLIRMYFHPIVLNSENIASDQVNSIIYASNHRSTLDPIVLESILKRNIHWVALERFFRGNDSIFNNSKNLILCNITKYLFKKLEYFPIIRKVDDSTANNIGSIINMNLFLKNGYQIGIFPEGTTKRETNQDFGKFDDLFMHLAKKNNSWIQPITILWRQSGREKFWGKVIVNIGEPFQVGKMSIEDAMENFMKIQRKMLKENREYMRWSVMN